MEIAVKIKVIRAVKDWSQAQLAEALGVNWTSVSAWENGKRGPNYTAVKKIEGLFEKVKDEIR